MKLKFQQAGKIPLPSTNPIPSLETIRKMDRYLRKVELVGTVAAFIFAGCVLRYVYLEISDSDVEIRAKGFESSGISWKTRDATFDNNAYSNDTASDLPLPPTQVPIQENTTNKILPKENVPASVSEDTISFVVIHSKKPNNNSDSPDSLGPIYPELPLLNTGLQFQNLGKWDNIDESYDDYDGDSLERLEPGKEGSGDSDDDGDESDDRNQDPTIPCCWSSKFYRMNPISVISVLKFNPEPEYEYNLCPNHKNGDTMHKYVLKIAGRQYFGYGTQVKDAKKMSARQALVDLYGDRYYRPAPDMKALEAECGI